MTIFGLNSPELFVLLVIVLAVLGIKRIEKGIDLFIRLLKFLLSDQSDLDKIQHERESTKEIENTQEKEKGITKKEKTNSQKKESTKEIEETQEKGKGITKREEKTNSQKKESTKEIEETQEKEKGITKREEKTNSQKKESIKETKNTSN